MADIFIFLHSNAYYTYGDLESAILAPKGGRQGCTFGAIIFNAVYAIALCQCHAKLENLGISFMVKQSAEVPWQDNLATAPIEKPVCDATYVDDEALVLLAKSPKLLDEGIDIMLEILVSTFSSFGLDINWAPGKTEIMLKYRGVGATKALNNRRLNGIVSVALPTQATAKHVKVVDKYKHLGSITAINNSDMYEIQHRCAEATAAYVPLSGKLFGSPAVGVWLKFHFMDSLIMSRLLYCVHNLTVSPKAIGKLNNVYMRVMRKISGHCRFSVSDNISDLQVRELCAKPSIDCLLVRARLRYIRRVCRHPAQALFLLLCMRYQSFAIPWVKQLMYDFGKLREYASAHGSSLPPSNAPFATWAAFFADQCAWDAVVGTIYYTSSVSDSHASASNCSSNTYICNTCPAAHDGSRPCWSTQKALDSHLRAKHGVLSVYRIYVDGSGVCPVCKTKFNSRLRCIAHLSDSRRKKCSTALVTGTYPTLDACTVTKLDLLDRESRRQAQQAGHTHPLAHKPAIKSDGKIVGRVSS